MDFFAAKKFNAFPQRKIHYPDREQQAPEAPFVHALPLAAVLPLADEALHRVAVGADRQAEPGGEFFLFCFSLGFFPCPFFSRSIFTRMCLS